MTNDDMWGVLYVQVLTFLREQALGLIIVIGLIVLVGRIISASASRYVHDEKKKHAVKKWNRYIIVLFIVLWIFILYNSHAQKDTPFYLFIIGIFLAGVALSMREIFSNFVGWTVILSSKGFNSGDRIRIGSVNGDVIDIGLLRTIVAEVGNWVGADQTTGRLVSIPNSFALTQEIYNYTRGYEFIWDEIRILVTFESNWQKAEEIINEIALADFNQKKELIEDRLKKVKREYLLHFNYITPKVYVGIKDSGIELSLRYMVSARQRRTLGDIITREILKRFDNERDINFAYPTVRVYQQQTATGPGKKDASDGF